MTNKTSNVCQFTHICLMWINHQLSTKNWKVAGLLQRCMCQLLDGENREKKQLAMGYWYCKKMCIKTISVYRYFDVFDNTGHYPVLSDRNLVLIWSIVFRNIMKYHDCYVYIRQATEATVMTSGFTTGSWQKSNLCLVWCVTISIILQ